VSSSDFSLGQNLSLFQQKNWENFGFFSSVNSIILLCLGEKKIAKNFTSKSLGGVGFKSKNKNLVLSR
jgi:hypothetical protein